MGSPPPSALILLGDSDGGRADALVGILRDWGFDVTVIVLDADELMRQLRLRQKHLHDIGLVILHETLTANSLDLASTIAAPELGIGIPVIVLSDNHTSQGPTLRTLARIGVSILQTDQIQPALLPLVSTSLLLRHERFLRTSQEEQLLSELADRKVMEARLKYLVSHDELTGLANRRYLEKKLRSIQCRNTPGSCPGVLLCIDVDRFSLINDIEGHDAGDRLLIEFVELLHTALAQDCITARIGGDEFCVLIEDVQDDSIAGLAERLRDTLANFWFHSGQESYRVSASIGVLPLDQALTGDHPGQLITLAYQACCMAKGRGRHGIYVYSEGDSDEVFAVHRDVHWVTAIREGLAENRFRLYFQPVIDLAEGSVAHHEVLLRLVGKDGSLHLPGEFLPAARRMDLCRLIDRWVVDNVVDLLASFGDLGPQSALSINLSMQSLSDDSFVQHLHDVVETAGADAKRLIFECTMEADSQTSAAVLHAFDALRAAGCRVALDNFGGSSGCFDDLRRMPVDLVKIDGRFIRELAKSAPDQAIVGAIVNVSHSLGVTAVAKNVETPGELRQARQLGVDLVQGFLLDRPAATLHFPTVDVAHFVR